MGYVESVLGKRVHIPQCESQPFAALAAGSAADPTAGQETPIVTVPNPSSFYNAPPVLGSIGEMAKMRLLIEQASFLNNGASNTAGNATHWADLQLLCYRFQSLNLPSGTNPGVYLQGILAYYSLKVATTIGTAVVAANLGTPFTVTPAAMTGIVPGMILGVDAGSATFELVMVLATTATTFTAIFTQAHITSATVASYLATNFPTPLVPSNGPVSTTGNGTVTAGANKTITPAAGGMYGVHVGDKLLLDTVGSGVQETVTVTAVTTTTFNCALANGHTSGYPIVTATGANGTAQPNPQGSALFNGPRFELQSGDVLKLTRTSSDATGIATLAGFIQLAWWPKDGAKA